MEKLLSVFATVQRNFKEQKLFILSEQAMQGKRVLALDVMKGVLILRMVFSHAWDGFGLEMLWFDSSKWIFQAIVFSGLIFTFGYGTYKAYLEKEKFSRRRIFVNIIRILLAYVVCGFVFGAFQLDRIGFQYILSLMRFDFLFDFSEFLLTYALILILLFIIPNIFRAIPRKDVIFWPVIAGLLLTTFIDYSKIKSIPLGLLIGTESASSYPVVQYLPLYLFGIYMAQRRNHFSTAIFIGSVISVVILFIAHEKGIANRFPPSFCWVLGSMGTSYLIFLLSHFIERISFLEKPLASVGRNALYWFVMSDLIIFTISRPLSAFALPPYWVALFILGVYFLIAFIGMLVRN